MHWVPVPFPIDALSSYLEKHHGAISRHVTKVDQKGFQMGIHMFEMRKDQITENPMGSYIYILGCEFLVKYAGQEATCHLCGKTGHKSAECEEKEENSGLSCKRINLGKLLLLITKIQMKQLFLTFSKTHPTHYSLRITVHKVMNEKIQKRIGLNW